MLCLNLMNTKLDHYKHLMIVNFLKLLANSSKNLSFELNNNFLSIRNHFIIFVFNLQTSIINLESTKQPSSSTIHTQILTVEWSIRTSSGSRLITSIITIAVIIIHSFERHSLATIQTDKIHIGRVERIFRYRYSSDPGHFVADCIFYHNTNNYEQ